MNAVEAKEFIDTLADLMSRSARTPILRRPDDYGLEYEDVFFPSLDGVPLEGWFIPANSYRLVIANHPMPCNRYGYPGTSHSGETSAGSKSTSCRSTRRYSAGVSARTRRSWA